MKGGSIVTVNEANQYIQINKEKVINRYRHNYHVMAPIGWINDPNGFSLFKDEYHLFYQYYPYDSEWGPMHWGHAKSKDFIKWETLPVALAPDQPYDVGGCFSGSAMQIGEELYLMYTGHTDPDKENPEAVREVQCLAKSTDGIAFEKCSKNPVISSDEVPGHARIQDFRDPKIWEKDGKYYVVIGSKRKDYKGQILFYTSEDLENWKYLNRFTLEEDFGSVWECPDLFMLDCRDVLIMSPQLLPEGKYGSQNIYACIAAIGNFDYSTGDYHVEHYQQLDSGFDFYAPQTVKAKDGRRIMIGWMNMWERESPLKDLGHYWRGSMTLPRELFIKSNKVYQQPVKEIQNYRKNEEIFYGLNINEEHSLEHIKLQSHELYIELDNMENKVLDIDLFKNGDESLKLTVDGIKKEVRLDRSNIGYSIESKNKPKDYIRKQSIDSMKEGIKLNIFVDVSSVEIFINDGEYVMTSLVYPKNEGHIAFRSCDLVTIKKFIKWDICV